MKWIIGIKILEKNKVYIFSLSNNKNKETKLFIFIYKYQINFLNQIKIQWISKLVILN